MEGKTRADFLNENAQQSKFLPSRTIYNIETFVSLRVFLRSLTHTHGEPVELNERTTELNSCATVEVDSLKRARWSSQIH